MQNLYIKYIELIYKTNTILYCINSIAFIKQKQLPLKLAV